jgi:hypothetical protein
VPPDGVPVRVWTFLRKVGPAGVWRRPYFSIKYVNKAHHEAAAWQPLDTCRWFHTVQPPSGSLRCFQWLPSPVVREMQQPVRNETQSSRRLRISVRRRHAVLRPISHQIYSVGSIKRNIKSCGQPTSFPELPRNIVQELQRRDCTIPQVAGFNKRQNVIHGEFGKPGQTDWAVLCAKAGFVELYVLWNGRERDIALVGRWPLGDPYDTAIAPVSRKYILDHYRAYGGPQPPPVDHQGIECSSGMASSILYFYKGKWLTLQGAD